MADPYDTPGYRYSVNEFPGDGTTINWNIQFAGRSPGYISIDHVRASIIDEDGVETPITLSQSNFVQPTLLRIEPPVPAGSVLRVWRDTPKDEPLLDYNDGALMTERNLDTSFDQAVYAAAEMVDRAADSLEDVEEFSLAVLDRLADVEDTANTARDTANTALDTADAAFAAAASAVSTSNDALAGVVGATEAADLATAAANAANAAAAVATAAANDAEQAATDSLSTAAAALSTAANAESVALGIDGKAQDALDTAAVAASTAANAESVALGIDSKAQAALDAAEDAVPRSQLQSSPTDATAGRLLAVGGAGIFGRSPNFPTSQYPLDFDAIDDMNIPFMTISGVWANGPGGAEPTGITGLLRCSIRQYNTSRPTVVQEFFGYWTGQNQVRYMLRSGSGSPGAMTWEDWEQVYTSASFSPWLAMPVGVAFPLWDHLASTLIPPANDPRFRYIKLTAGDSYNSGVLTSETVTGSAPLITAQATVSLAGSPINGAVVALINTERTMLRPGDSGALQDDAFQAHAWGLNFPGSSGSNVTPPVIRMRENNGAANNADRLPLGGGNTVSGTIEVTGPYEAGSNGTPRTANETRMRNRGATYYMRVK